MPLLVLAVVAAYIFFNRPEIFSRIAGGFNSDTGGVTSGETPFAQSLISTTIAPMGSAVNPRLMTYTTFSLKLPHGTTRAEAERIITERGSNIPLRDFQFVDGWLYLTVISNDTPELDGFQRALESRPDIEAVNVINSQTVRYYLLANNWVSELDAEAWIADCPRQKALNPNVGFGECPTSLPWL